MMSYERRVARRGGKLTDAPQPEEATMKITIESTDKIVTFRINGVDVPARMWQGETESGIQVHCFITRIAPEIRTSDPRIDELTAEFERDLKRTATPRPTVEAIPLRMIL